jgi:hypothetical protein
LQQIDCGKYSYFSLEYIYPVLLKNIIYEKSIMCLTVTVNFALFLEAIQAEEPRRTVPQIPTTPTSWLLLSFCVAAVIAKPDPCSSLMDRSEYSQRH